LLTAPVLLFFCRPAALGGPSSIPGNAASGTRPAEEGPAGGLAAEERLRLIVETDAGGDPDDEQSLVRFLLYVNEWDIEGIIVNRAEARPGENRNSERTGLGIVRALVDAYGKCHPRLVEHDPRYPPPEELRKRTVPGYGPGEEGVRLILDAAARNDPRPIWFLNWGTDNGSEPSSLRLVLDRALRERGPAGYAELKGRFRLSSDDQFREHTTAIDPPWKLWVDTFRPPRDGKRWYHRFSDITARAGGFDIERDVRSGHGPLGALYPTNTTHPQKEGDTMTFLYLVPTGMNDPAEPAWGSWAGRYGPRDGAAGKPYWWATGADQWEGKSHRDNSLVRWAVHIQNDFKARMDWCVKDRAGANHPPVARLAGEAARTAAPGDVVVLDASGSSDPDGDQLRFEWIHHAEPGTYRGPAIDISGAAAPRASFRAPGVGASATVHVILVVTDTGEPSLTRYRRVVVTVKSLFQ
jgi:hypothetical protein